MKASRALGLAVSLIAVVVVGGGQPGGLNLIVEQIRTIGTRQWLGLMAGSIVPDGLAIAPLTERVARLLPGRAPAPVERGTSTVAAA